MFHLLVALTIIQICINDGIWKTFVFCNLDLYLFIFWLLFFVCSLLWKFRCVWIANLSLKMCCIPRMVCTGRSRSQFFNNPKMAQTFVQQPSFHPAVYYAFAYRPAMGNYTPQIYKHIASMCKHGNRNCPETWSKKVRGTTKSMKTMCIITWNIVFYCTHCTTHCYPLSLWTWDGKPKSIRM